MKREHRDDRIDIAYNALIVQFRQKDERPRPCIWMEFGGRNMPEFAWPTVLLTLALLGGFATSTWLALAAHLPLWLAAGINTIVIYAIYTPLHDATHSAIVPRAKRWRWVNSAVGIAAAIPLWMPPVSPLCACANPASWPCSATALVS